MIDETLQIIKIASVIVNTLKESQVKKIAQNELAIAINIGQHIQDDYNPREGLNRMLTHLESAYVHSLTDLGTWDIWDRKKIMWNQWTSLNRICLIIVTIHYMLGNTSNATRWLLENMSNAGSCDFYDAYMKELGFNNSEDFYKGILGDKYPIFYDKVLKSSRLQEQSFESSWEFDLMCSESIIRQM